MAERAASIVVKDDKTFTVTWTGLLNGDTGATAFVSQFADKTVQITGTTGAGLDVSMEGSNIATAEWGKLDDPQGVLIAIGDKNPIVIAGNPMQIRPNVIAGDGATNVTVTINGTLKGP